MIFKERHCTKIRKLLGKELASCTRLEKAQVRHHLDHCKACREYVLAHTYSITCDECKALIERWHGKNDLSEREKTATMKHFKECPHCQEYLAQKEVQERESR